MKINYKKYVFISYVIINKKKNSLLFGGKFKKIVQ